MLRKLLSSFRRSRKIRSPLEFRAPRMEVLEVRRMLAIVDWTGAGDAGSQFTLLTTLFQDES